MLNRTFVSLALVLTGLGLLAACSSGSGLTAESADQAVIEIESRQVEDQVKAVDPTPAVAAESNDAIEDDVSGEDDLRLEDLLGLWANIEPIDELHIGSGWSLAFIGSEADTQLFFQAECGSGRLAVSQSRYSITVGEGQWDGCDETFAHQIFQPGEIFRIETTREPGYLADLANGDVRLTLLPRPSDDPQLQLAEDDLERTYVLPDEDNS